ncbi:MAG: phosphoglycerate dehydrogenase [Actinomycetota bacterium]|nr:phosphoglycerate dehydrogenase [Actinomycetota bacterium]
MKVLIPRSLELTLDVPDGDSLVSYDPTLPVADADLDAQVLIADGNTAAQLADTAERLVHLLWVQSLAAGTEAMLTAGLREGVVITSGRGLHDATVAEHTLALVLSGLRSLPTLGRLQQRHEWSNQFGGAQREGPNDPLITLAGANVTIWGFGSIAAALAPLLRALGAHVVGVAHTAGERAGFPVIAVDELDARLAVTDILIGIIPGSPENRQVIDARRIGLLPARAWIINVGRGSTLDETALLQALRDGRIAGAALDVFEHEPLPPESPLWDEPRLTITPHSAGGRPRGAAALITRNLDALHRGVPLENVVPRT